MTIIAQSQKGSSPDRGRLGAGSVAFGFGLILPQLFLAVRVIPRFSNIFRDLLGDQPLPTLTAIVLSCRWLLVGISCILAIVALVIILRSLSMRYLYAIFALLFVQIALTVFALYLPLGTFLQAMKATP